MEPNIILYGDTSQPIKVIFSIFFRDEIHLQRFLMRVLRTSRRKCVVVARNKIEKKNFIGFKDSHDGIWAGIVEVFSCVAI